MSKGASKDDVHVGLSRLIANLVPDVARPIFRNVWASFNRLKVKFRRLLPQGGAHNLPGELIVSLTSHPPRFSTLHLSLECLLRQSVKPDRLILWIAHQDICSLPYKVTRLRRLGLEIRACDDLRSYKKLVPSLLQFPDAFIVTADDDLYYERGWLKLLIDGLQAGSRTIIARRVVRLRRANDRSLSPFNEWTGDANDIAARNPSGDIMSETGAGALFPPRCLDPRATDQNLFQRLAPNGDDLWFYWCARMKGTLTKKVGGSLILVPWPETEASSLWTTNEHGGNDEMVESLVNEFGLVDGDAISCGVK
jgi:hypothetical protein